MRSIEAQTLRLLVFAAPLKAAGAQGKGMPLTVHETVDSDTLQPPEQEQKEARGRVLRHPLPKPLVSVICSRQGVAVLSHGMFLVPLSSLVPFAKRPLASWSQEASEKSQRPEPLDARQDGWRLRTSFVIASYALSLLIVQ